LPDPWKAIAGEITAFEPLQPDIDLRRPVSVVAECARQFPMDEFCTPSFYPELFDDGSMFLFVHILPITVFRDASVWNSVCYSLTFFLEICSHSSSWRANGYVIANGNPHEESHVQRWQRGDSAYPLCRSHRANTCMNLSREKSTKLAQIDRINETTPDDSSRMN
jgi:hypothetical protein